MHAGQSLQELVLCVAIARENPRQCPARTGLGLVRLGRGLVVPASRQNGTCEIGTLQHRSEETTLRLRTRACHHACLYKWRLTRKRAHRENSCSRSAPGWLGLLNLPLIHACRFLEAAAPRLAGCGRSLRSPPGRTWKSAVTQREAGLCAFSIWHGRDSALRHWLARRRPHGRGPRVPWIPLLPGEPPSPELPWSCRNRNSAAPA